MATARLLKVTVQPVFVVDDGEHLHERTLMEPVTLTASDWQKFVETGLDELVESAAESFTTT